MSPIPHIKERSVGAVVDDLLHQNPGAKVSICPIAAPDTGGKRVWRRLIDLNGDIDPAVVRVTRIVLLEGVEVAWVDEVRPIAGIDPESICQHRRDPKGNA